MEITKVTEELNNKKIILFDLDRTLAESRSPIDLKMSELLKSLISKYKVGIISGGGYKQIKKQVISNLGEDTLFSNLYILPTSGSSLNVYEKGWKNIYKETLKKEEKELIITSLKEAINESGIDMPNKIYGERIEDRESQITFSALGQEAPLEKKKVWDPDKKKRKKIQKLLELSLQNYEVLIGGSNTLDITKKGVNKGYGIRKLIEYLNIPVDEMLFVGDRLEPGGNDYAVVETGIDWIEVSGPKHTKKVIQNLLKIKK